MAPKTWIDDFRGFTGSNLTPGHPSDPPIHQASPRIRTPSADISRLEPPDRVGSTPSGRDLQPRPWEPSPVGGRFFFYLGP